MITKMGLQELPPILFTCIRYTLIVFPLIFFIKRDTLTWRLILQIGTTLGVFTFTLAFIGINLGMPAGMTSLLMQFQVIFTLILSAIFLKDSPTTNQRIGAAVAICGICILIFDSSNSLSVIGLSFVLAGAFFSGLTKIFMKKGGNYDTFRLMVWMSIIPPVPLLLLSLIFETGQIDALMNISYKGITALLFNSFVSTLVGFGLIGYLIKLYSPNKIVPYAFLVPVFGLILGYLFFGETLSSAEVVACVFILCGLIYPQYVSIKNAT